MHSKEKIIILSPKAIICNEMDKNGSFIWLDENKFYYKQSVITAKAIVVPLCSDH